MNMKFSFGIVMIVSNLLCLSFGSSSVNSNSTEGTNSNSKKYSLPFRNKNVDYWDDETLSAYLHIDPETLEKKKGKRNSLPDAVIMFYAQWCTNCHALAPLYDKIATLINAGFEDSNRLMVLYDCERTTNSKKICSNIGVTGYPTLMYISQQTRYIDSDWLTRTLFGVKRSCGPMGCTKQSHAVKFQGDWRYGDEILDWIAIMGGISSWKKWTNGLKESWKNRRFNTKNHLYRCRLVLRF